MVLLLDVLDLHQNDCLGSADQNDSSSLADGALQSESDLFGCFGLLSEDGFRLAAVA